jgi:hypothetical protein
LIFLLLPWISARATISARPPSFFRPTRVIYHRPTPLLLSWAASFPPAQPPASHPTRPWPPAGSATSTLSSHCRVGPAQLLPPRETDGAATGATASTRAHRPGVPSSPGNGVAPPSSPPACPSFPLPKTEGVKGINGALHRRPIPLPVRPPRSPLRPYKRVRSSPLLTALLLAPISHSPRP